MAIEIKLTTDDLMTVETTAKDLNKPRSTIYRWIEKRKLASIRLGGIIYIPVSEVERLKSE